MSMEEAQCDTSGFQNIVLMLIGVLMILLISNVLTIISNPENIQIGSLVTGAVYTDGSEEDVLGTPKFQNLRQDPIYVEVRPDRIVLVEEDIEIMARDLMFEGNQFETFLANVEQMKDRRYIVLLLRPDAATFQRQLRKIIRDRGIGMGFEPWEYERPIIVQRQTEE